ncbi:hypothetical protein DBR42_02525 [Pelomonas sp. HMWF004]|nr:hypothetical protein DBR42_02525 [Pelomonas sp. HMWF004]
MMLHCLRIASCALGFLLGCAPVWAGCQGSWLHPKAQAMTISPDGEFRLTRFGNNEVRVFSRSSGDPPVEVLMVRGAILVKGVSEEKIWRFAQDSPWLMMTAAPVLSALADTVKAGPCGGTGHHPIAVRMGGQWSDGKSRLVHAAGTVTIARPGEVAFSIRFDTEPPQPEGHSPVYAGTLSFLDTAPEPPEATDISGFSVVRGGEEIFVAPSGMTLGQLRVRLSQGKS